MFLILNETKMLSISMGMMHALAHLKYFNFLICELKIQKYCKNTLPMKLAVLLDVFIANIFFFMGE